MKMYFNYGTVGSGKTLELLKMAINYRRRGKKVLLLTSSIDNRSGVGKISTRFGAEHLSKEIGDEFGIQEDALLIEKMENLKGFVQDNFYEHVLCDEVQFYRMQDIDALVGVVTDLDIPVSCFGLKSNYKGELFDSIARLMVFADKIQEVKTSCYACDRKAVLNLRIHNGVPVYEGDDIYIGGQDNYLPACREHWFYPQL